MQMTSYTIPANDLGLDESGLSVHNGPIFDDFKPLAELVFTEDELAQYKTQQLKALQAEQTRRTAAAVPSVLAKGQEEDEDLDQADAMDVDATTTSSVRLVRYLKMDKVELSNWQRDQLLYVTLVGISKKLGSLSKIESFLDFVSAQAGVTGSYHWTTVEDDLVEWDKPVYVRFHKVMDMVRFVLYLENVQEDKRLGKPVLESNCEKLFEDKKGEVGELTVDSDAFAGRVQEIESMRGETDADKGNNDIYSDYQIDMKELVDVPKDKLDTVKEDIVEFRLRVLKLEKAKRERESVNDKKKSRFKAKRLYQDISNTNNSNTGLFGEADEDDEVEDDEDEEEEQVDDLEAEQLQQESLKRRENDEYEARLELMRSQDRQRAQLLEKITIVKNYETEQVPAKRSKFIKEFVDVEDASNKVDANLESFYLKHKNYLKFRERVKLKEIEADMADLERDVGKFIDTLIDEYIGVQDEDLRNYVLKLCDEHFPDKSPVVEGLREPLDEDSQEFVNKLWDLIGV